MKFNPLALFKKFKQSTGSNINNVSDSNQSNSNDTCPKSESGHDFVFQTYYDAYTEADEPVFEDGDAEYTKRGTAMFECTLCDEVDLRKSDEERVSRDDVADEFDKF